MCPQQPIKEDPDICTTAEAQGKDFKIAIMNLFNVFKEDMKIIHWLKSMKTQTLEWNGEPVTNMEVKRNSKKKTQTEGKLWMKKLGTWTGTSETSLTNSIWEIERILSVEDQILEMGTLVKENVNCKKKQTNKKLQKKLCMKYGKPW